MLMHLHEIAEVEEKCYHTRRKVVPEHSHDG